MFKSNKKSFYIILFAILWLITAFSSFFHAVEFFELSNVTWMGIILALAFEIGQASVLMSILTSSQDRKKYTPWILMCILTLVQIIGNVYSSYKYIMLNSPENLKYFKEPIFIWTDLPDAEATVIITYVSAAILPIVALLMTSMITNYLTDQSEENNEPILISEIHSDKGPENPPIEIKNEEDFKKVYFPPVNKDNIDNGQLYYEGEEVPDKIDEENNDGEKNEIKESESNNDNGEQPVGTVENKSTTESETPENIEPKNDGKNNESNSGNDQQGTEQTKLEGDKSGNGKSDIVYDPDAYDRAKFENMVDKEVIQDMVTKKDSHFINL